MLSKVSSRISCAAAVATLCAIGCTAQSFADDLVLAKKGVAPLRNAVLLPNNPTESQRFAAEELASYAKRITGAGLSARVVIENPDAALGEDGFRLYVAKSKLHIVGGKRGALYGVYEVLERFGGCGWFSSKVEVVPKKRVLSVPADLDVTEKPAFPLRSTSWSVIMRHPQMAARLRINGLVVGMTEKFGGLGYRFAKGAGICHTFNQQIPSDVWFKSHPEYFCERNGKRRSGRDVQPCLSNPDVLRIVVSNVLESIKKDPGANIVGVSQNDNCNFCQCEKCEAVLKEEGAQSGLMLRFVNAVAEEVEKVRPDVIVQTLAYQYSKKSPKKTRPRHNVMPCLCLIGNKRHVPIADTELAKWGAMSSHLMVWDYSTNYSNYWYPMPIEDLLAVNMRTFRDDHVTLMFPEGCGVRAEFSELKAYLLAKLMWNPDLDVKALVDRFFAGFYGAAAPFVREYYDRTRKLAAETKESFWVFSEEPPRWYTPELSAWARGRFRLAAEAVSGDPVRLDNVRHAELTPIVVELVRNAKVAKNIFVTRTPERFPSFGALASDYRQACSTLGSEQTVRRNARHLLGWRRAFAETPDRTPRDETEFGVSVFGASPRIDVVDDADGLGGRVLCHKPTSTSMETKLYFSNVAFDDDAEYEIAFRCKTLRDKGDGEAFQAALGPMDSKVVAGKAEVDSQPGVSELITRRVSEVSDGWEWYKFRPRKLTEDLVFAFGSGSWKRGGGIGATKGVLLDRVRFRRVSKKEVVQ